MADADKKGWLDRSRDYAQHYGDEFGRAFEQDGRHFNFDGSPWSPKGERAEVKSTKPAVVKAAAPVADDQLTQQLKG